MKTKWRDRFISVLESSLRVLGPHRVTLRALAPVMVGDVEEGVFAASSAFFRRRVQGVFRSAVADATDAPSPAVADAVGRLLYLLHLAVLLWWLLDKSPRQRATHALVTLFGQMLPSAALTLRLPPARRFVQSADRDYFFFAICNSPSLATMSGPAEAGFTALSMWRILPSGAM